MHVLSRGAYSVLLLGDIGALYSAVWVTLIVRNFSFPSVESAAIHLTSFTLLFLAWFLVYALMGLYGRYTILFRKQLPNTIVAAQAINIVIAALFFFFIPLFAITPKTVLAIYLVISTLLLYVWRVHVFPYLLIQREIGAVLVGTGSELTALTEEVNKDPLYPMEFRAIIHPELIAEEDAKKTISLLIESNSVSTVVADMENRSLDTLLRFLYEVTFVKQNAVFIDVRRVYQEVFERVPLSLIDDRWLLRYMSPEQRTLYAFLKRVIDVMASLILGAASLVLYPIIILAIKLDSKGPIFYITDRVGLGGKTFRFVKFRSMTGTDNGKEALTTAHTVTRVGKFLRRSRFDELPQLWNVLKGDMSFIGPRPEFPALVDAYKDTVPHYHLRHLVKPGLSGWAQVKHDNHAHHGVDATATSEKLAYDLYYIKERSLLFDMQIVFLTVKTLLFHRGS
jgi:exopolysaccharide biosynthesis polyprenyl glycosylphosphotransferase